MPSGGQNHNFNFSLQYLRNIFQLWDFFKPIGSWQTHNSKNSHNGNTFSVRVTLCDSRRRVVASVLPQPTPKNVPWFHDEKWGCQPMCVLGGSLSTLPSIYAHPNVQVQCRTCQTPSLPSLMQFCPGCGQGNPFTGTAGNEVVGQGQKELKTCEKDFRGALPLPLFLSQF